VALAWARQKYIHTYPLVGGAKVSHLKGNIDALNIHLSDKQIEALDGAIPYDPGFPANVFGTDPRLNADKRPATNFLINTVSVMGLKCGIYRSTADVIGCAPAV
jgi:hypothetical protein